MKKNILLLLFFLFPIANTTFAYSVDTHTIISARATENSKLALDKGDYLKNLGFQNNIDEKFSGKEVIKLIMVGSVDEDKSGRYINHYHNPLKSWADAGLNDITTGQSSLLWAQQDIPHQFPNEFSWQAVRRYYLDALTTGSEGSFAKTFKGLGHIIHLLQDAAQPAHVRNDAHVLDPYSIPILPLLYKLEFIQRLETWSNNNPTIISGFASQPVFPTVDLSVSVIGYEPITQFFDTAPGTYDGTNPSTSLSQGLAEYTNANFFSEDTIFTENKDPNHKHYFPFPRKEDTLQYDEYIGNGKYRTYFRKLSNGEPINHLATIEKLYKYLFPGFIIQYNYHFLDEKCHEDYTEKLIPRAVGYSTGLIDYFFRGEIEIIQIPNSNNIKIKNNSSETMDGIFTLYYDATDGNRYQVSDGSWYLPSLQAGETSDELTFTEPTDMAEGKQHILVFQGTLGSETGAVVGWIGWTCVPFGFVDKFGADGSGNGQFRTPFGIAVDDNYLYVLDTARYDIQIFNKTSPYNFIAKFGEFGTGDGQFESPGGPIVDDNYIYIQDVAKGNVKVFDKTFPYDFVTTFGEFGPPSSPYFIVHGLALNSGKIYVLNKFYAAEVPEHKIWIFGICPQ